MVKNEWYGTPKSSISMVFSIKKTILFWGIPYGPIYGNHIWSVVILEDGSEASLEDSTIESKPAQTCFDPTVKMVIAMVTS